MLKIIRYTLYSLAVLVGVLGLFVGGDPLVKYLLEIWRDAQNNEYYDIHYLNEPEIIVLLSLILLVGVRIAMALDKGIRTANPPDTGSRGKKPEAPAAVPAQPATVSDTGRPAMQTVDEKLARLLNQKKD